MEDQSSSWFWMLAIILAVPIMAYMVGGWAHSKYESDWQSVLKEQYPYSSPASRSALTLSKVCQEPQVSNARLCKELGYLSLMRFGSVAAAILGLGLWAGIAFAAQQAAGNRERLLALFRPGLYLTILGLIGLLSVQVALICATIYFGETAATGGFHPFFIVAAALGGLVGVLAMIGGIIGCLRPLSIQVIGRSLSRADAPELWQFVSDLARQIGTSSPQSIVVGLEDNFYVTSANVTTLDGEQPGPTMYLSLPLCRLLDKSEFTSVIAHELAHFKGEDTRYSKEFMPIYRGASEALVRMFANIGKNLRSFVVLPAALILYYFLNAFTTAERQIGRQREFDADRVAVNATDSMLLASALLKIHAVGGLWGITVDYMNTAASDGKVLRNIGPIYEDIAVTHVFTNEAALRDLGQVHTPHPTDTHPSLTDRLESIGWTTASAVDVVQRPAEPAITLIRNFEEIEEYLTEKWNVLLFHLQNITMTSTSVTERGRDVTDGILAVTREVRQKLSEEPTFEPDVKSLFWESHISKVRANRDGTQQILEALADADDPKAAWLRRITQELTAILSSSESISVDNARNHVDARRALVFSGTSAYMVHIQSGDPELEWKIYEGTVNGLQLSTATTG